jgi:DNA-binding NarL/FixJ family response regulator
MARTPHPAPSTVQLTPGNLAVARELVTGADNTAIAARLGIRPHSVTWAMKRIGQHTGATSRAQRAHALLTQRLVDPPAAPSVPPDFDAQELSLLRAVAEQPDIHQIADAAGTTSTRADKQIQALVAKAGAGNRVRLIGYAHAWGLFASGPDGQTAPAGSHR